MDSPTAVTSDLRFSARVDYFATAEEAEQFARARRAEGFNVCGGSSILSPDQWPSAAEGDYAGLYGVHWVDREGEGWYG